MIAPIPAGLDDGLVLPDPLPSAPAARVLNVTPTARDIQNASVPVDAILTQNPIVRQQTLAHTVRVP